jgi:signal transduction histidine kinase
MIKTKSNTSSPSHGKQAPKLSFWLLHFAGWFSYVIIFTFDNVLFTHNEKASLTIIFPLIVSGLIAALLTLPMRYVYRNCWHLQAKSLLLCIMSASLLAALIWTPLKNLAMSRLKSNVGYAEWLSESASMADNPWAILDGLGYSFFMILVWSSLYFGINYHYRLVNEKQLHFEAARLSHKAQIKMLRYQINPHFLFNTLNAISTLVLLDQKEKANGMLARLSTFLRFSLDNDPEQKIPLIDELKASMLYLEIEKTRFDERLSINMEVHPDAENLLVPSLLLQPIIENAIKYAIANMASGGVISIKADCNNDHLNLCISDNGPGVPKAKIKDSTMSKVGLQNIKERLAVLYPGRHRFDTQQLVPQGFEVSITIPKELA